MLFRVFVSCGKNLRSTPPSETPLEIPSEDTAQTMEAAAAATSACVNLQDDEEMDVMTTAEPEMEVDDSLTEADPDAEDLQDQHQEEVAKRRPVLLQERTLLTDPTLTQARVSLQVAYLSDAEAAQCIDPKAVSFAHVNYICAMYLRVANIKWTTLCNMRS